MTGVLSIVPVLAPGIRLMLAGAATVILAFWTVTRLLGSDDDPTIRHQATSETGTLSFLVSGTMAVAMVSGVVALAVAPEILAGTLVGYLTVGLLAVVVVMHWLVEKTEANAA